MQKYTENELRAMGIFELRVLAKAVGVSAPTKINKSELVDYIYKISNGIMQPPAAPHKGRPAKTEAETRSTAKISVAPPTPKGVIPTFRSSSDDEEPRNKGIFTTASDYYRPNKNRLSDKYFRNETTPEFIHAGLSDNPRGSRYNDSPREEEFVQREGYLELSSDDYGFLRVKSGECNELDAYVNVSKIKYFGLRRGDYVVANCRKLQDGKPAALHEVLTINGMPVSETKNRPNFDNLTPIYPDTRLKLEVPNKSRDYAMRCIDLVSPIGKGQRGIIVSPPKAGKTTLLKMIANSISQNYPDVVLKVLLIDERPEEVTDMQRSINGEVVYSTFDETSEHHTKTAEVLLDKCKRIVETGKDVVILLDSITRLARAYNNTVAPSGRTLSGGIDPSALFVPKRIFGSARNLEANGNFKGGSLTIIATALIETGSRMDDVIFEEFKGTGNMEIHLDRRLSEKRIFPAIDLSKSSTRKEELLLGADELEAVWGIRKMLSNTDNAEATENLLSMIIKTSSNKEFIDQLNLQLRLAQKDGYVVRSLKT